MLIYQNDKRCLKDIQEVGCFVRCSARLAEMEFNKELTASQINDIWVWGVDNGYIVDRALNNSQKTANKAISILGEKGRFVEIGTFKNGIVKYYSGVSEELKSAEHFFIQKIKTGTTYGTHFRVVDKYGVVLFDPYFPAVKAVGVEYSIIYALVK